MYLAGIWRRAASAAAGVFLAGFAWPVAADETDLAQERPARTVTLPDVVVTGTRPADTEGTGSRLNIPLADIPATVEVIDQETLHRRGDRTTLEAVEKAVGWSGGYSAGNGVSFSTRGFVGNDIGILHDGTRIAPPGMSARQFDTFLYDRIEVLNGPGSSLHGEGAISGVVNYVSKNPDPTRFAREFVASYGSFNSPRGAFALNVPVGEKRDLAYRVDGVVSHSDGFVDETEYDRYHLIGSVRSDTRPDLRVTLKAELFADDIRDHFGLPLNNGKVDERLLHKNYNVSDRKTRADQMVLRLDTDYTLAPGIAIKNQVYGLNANRHWRNAEAYRFLPATSQVEITALGDVRHEQHLFGDRIHALIDLPVLGHANRFAAGVEVNRNNFRRNATFPDVSFLVPAFAPNTPSFNQLNNNGALNPGTTTVITTTSAFFEDQFEIVKGFKISGGFRFDRYDVDVDNHQTGRQEQKPFFAPTGRAGIVYEPLAGTTLYGHYVSGTNPSRNFTLGRALDFALESSTEYELGVRQKFWGNRAEAGIAVYDIVKENILTQRPNNANVTDNIGRQSARGVEISLGVEPVAGWRVGGNASFLTAEFDEFNVSGQSFAGRVPPNVPRQLGNLWTHYRFGNGFDVGGNVRYVGPRSGDNAGTFVLPSYATLDLYASYTVNNWEFSLRGRNLTDELAIVWSETDYTQQVQTGEPRAIEARVTARF
ncbi:MAG: TonB-dependent siderophore receptor [Rhodospirillales bacterium]|nr:TonB-dependent siderophore receptor [Rhodospirillales bacterium]